MKTKNLDICEEIIQPMLKERKRGEIFITSPVF